MWGVLCPEGRRSKFWLVGVFPVAERATSGSYLILGPFGRCPLLHTSQRASAPGMSGDEHPSMTKTHWRDAAPPLFTKEQLESSSGTATSLDMATLLALFAFVGVVVPQRPRAREC